MIHLFEEKFMHKKRVGFTCGTFDLLHTGHALMLEEARDQCDWLVVGVQSDPSLDRRNKNKPIQAYDERVAMVQSIKWVDEVCCYDTEDQLYNLLIEINPAIRIVGADWKGRKFTGHDLDIAVFFNTRDHDYSTSNLRERVYLAEAAKRKQAVKSKFVKNSLADLHIRDRQGR
jgi:glycerol-3-phosphate cytidylyltransferase